jgi:hypothetical protein
MPLRLSIRSFVLAFMLSAFAVGCGPTRPAVVEARGVVLLNNQPLPNAVVEFVPTLEGFGLEIKAVGTTDDQGRFSLKCNWQEQSGAAVGKNKVVVYDGAPPGNVEARERGARTRSPNNPPAPQLPNRPIPQKYNTLASTTLEVEVKPDQSEYKIELTRP